MRLLHDLLDRSPGLAADREALRYHGVGTSFRQLRDASFATARGLSDLGVKRGDRVVTLLQNRPEVIEIALACSRLGAIFVPVSPALRPRQLLHVLQDSGACALVTAGPSLSQVAPVCVQSTRIRNIIFTDTPEFRRPIAERVCLVALDDVRSSDTDIAELPVIDRDPAAILYTSGSTGRSKGVVISHRNLVCGAEYVAEYLHNSEDDRILAALPLSFDYGLSQVTTALQVGATCILTNFSMPAALMQEAADERITALAGVPTMWAHLAASDWPASVRASLRYITNSGGALHPALLGQLRSRLPTTSIYCMYGLTEAFRSTYLDPAELERKTGSIGKALPNQEMVVLRPDGSLCAPGEAGELVHRGSLVTLGYWNDDAETAKRFRPLPAGASNAPPTELAVWSGDLVRADEEGFLYFVGRVDHMIKTSGYRVSPTEVEEVIAEVEGVMEVAAVGLPDPVIGQRIVVALVAKPGADASLVEQLRRHCRMHLPAYMAPQEFVLVDSIERGPNGKPDRGALLQRLASEAAKRQSTPAPLGAIA
jgi:acyl-CoA ligase (AMP-forming) (exosortase A-associated)